MIIDICLCCHGGSCGRRACRDPAKAKSLWSWQVGQPLWTYWVERHPTGRWLSGNNYLKLQKVEKLMVKGTTVIAKTRGGDRRPGEWLNMSSSCGVRDEYAETRIHQAGTAREVHPTMQDTNSYDTEFITAFNIHKLCSVQRGPKQAWGTGQILITYYRDKRQFPGFIFYQYHLQFAAKRMGTTVRPGLKGPPSSRPFRVILIGLRKISRNFSTFHILTSQQFLETVSRFFAQTVRSYVCNIVLHPLLMAYVVEICDNYADLSHKVLLPMYIVHVLCAPRVWANPKQK